MPTVTSPPSLVSTFNVRDYGAKGDGTTDDSAAFVAALAAAGVSGGVVHVPIGTYQIKQTLYIPTRVRVEGEGYNSLIRADAAATLDTYSAGTKKKFIQLGPSDGTLAFGTVLRGVKVNAGGLAATTAVYTSNIQENCGVYDCAISGYTADGFRAEGLSGLPQNFTLEDLHINAGIESGGGVASGNGISLSAVPWCRIQRVSVVPNNAVTQTNRSGVWIAAGGVRIQSLHVENHTHGVQNDASNVTVDDLSCGNVTNMIDIVQFSGAATVIRASGLVKSTGVTRAINNEITSVLITAPPVEYTYGGTVYADSVTLPSGDTDSKYAPQIAAIVCPLPDLRLFNASAAYTANDAKGMRVVVPRSGTLTDLSVFIVTQSGNIDVGVYSLAAEPRARLYSTGSLACPAAGWQIVGNPNLAVTQGQLLEFVLASDNATASFGRFVPAATGVPFLPANFWPTGSGTLKIGWVKATSFPLPSTLADSGLNANNTIVAVIARIA